MAKSFTIQLEALDYNLKNFDDRACRAIDKAVTFQAAKTETWMRTEAPWQDQTTNARNGLFAMNNRLWERTWLLIMSHSVPYGIWLEVRNSGKYAIVRPAFLKTNRELMNLLSRTFTRMERGRK